jgi:hypothetical protein
MDIYICLSVYLKIFNNKVIYLDLKYIDDLLHVFKNAL